MPGVLALDAVGGWMLVEWVGGGTVRERLVGLRRWREGRAEGEGKCEEKLRGLMERVGEAVGRLHEVGVVHGDLTSSNLMLRSGQEDPTSTDDGVVENEEATKAEEEEGVSLEGEVVLIDFGLAAQSVQDEDKAVDLYVLERAFGSTHPELEEDFKIVLEAYGKSHKGARVVLKKLEEVRMRGRKKSMIG